MFFQRIHFDFHRCFNKCLYIHIYIYIYNQIITLATLPAYEISLLLFNMDYISLVVYNNQIVSHIQLKNLKNLMKLFKIVNISLEYTYLNIYTFLKISLLYFFQISYGGSF